MAAKLRNLPIDDKSLVCRLRSDDRSAFDLLYHKYHSPLYRCVLKLLKDEESSQDILQDVFFSLWERRASIDPDKAIASWIFAVAYNKSLNWLKQKAKSHLSLPVNFADIPEDKSLPMITEAHLILVEEAVELLSPQKKKVFQICKVEGRTYEQAARELSISRHTVKEYLSEAVTSVKLHVERFAADHITLLAWAFLYFLK